METLTLILLVVAFLCFIGAAFKLPTAVDLPNMAWAALVLALISHLV